MASEAIAQAPHGAAVGSMGEAAAAAAEHGGAFPPFDPTFFPSQLLWLAVTFGALYWLSSRVLLPRLSGIIEDRRDRIADDLAEAERLKRESEEAIAAYERELEEARANARRIAQETHEALAAETEARRKAIEAELAEKLAAAEARILEIKQRALAEVGGIASETAAAVVERFGGKADARVEAAVAEVMGK